MIDNCSLSKIQMCHNERFCVNKRHKTSVLSFVVFVIIFFSSDTLLFGNNYDTRYIMFGYVFFIIFGTTLTLGKMISANIMTVNEKGVKTIILLSISIISSTISNKDFSGGSFLVIIFAIVSFMFTEKNEANRFWISYDSVLRLLSISSLIGFTFFTFFRGLNHYGYFVQKSIGGTAFYHYFLYMHCTDYIGAQRNWGIFREPGVYQAYLVVALLIEIYMIKKNYYKKNKWWVLVIVLTILTTKSTTGYICLMVTAIYCFFTFSLKNNMIKRNSIMAGGLLLVLVVGAFIFSNKYMNHVLINDIFGKLSKNSDAYISSFARFSSLSVNFVLWIRKPLFGLGIVAKNSLFPELSEGMYGIVNRADTNTLMAQFSTFGVFVGVIWLFAIYNMARTLTNNKKDFCFLIIILLIVYMTEYYVFSPIMNIFIWYGLKYKRNGKPYLHCNNHYSPVAGIAKTE